jgi:isocitrate dehydrogenase
LQKFAELLERSVIETVEKGFMTKDLAMIVHNTSKLQKSQYCETVEFIKKVREVYEHNAHSPKL